MVIGFTVRGFKSLASFQLTPKEGLSNFTCLVGLNGAGKSSVLQYLDFASHLMRGDVESWLAARSWSIADLHSKMSTSSNILLTFTIRLKNKKLYSWVGSFNRAQMACTTERVIDHSSNHSNAFILMRGRYSFYEAPLTKVKFNYQGSILSALKDDAIPEEIIRVRDTIANIKSLELLSPHLMRYSLREAATDIGPGGQKLSPFLYGIKGAERERLVSLLKEFYPSVVDFKVKQERAGWKKLYIIEDFNGDLIETEAKHVNDGLLRILAILAQSASGNSMLLFDEVENGVNPEIIEKLVNILQKTNQQVIVTTHSPMILNYLSDRVASSSIHFIYRSFDGSTRSRLFFNIPRMTEKLRIMGPGEVFVDTQLSELSKECAREDLESQPSTDLPVKP